MRKRLIKKFIVSIFSAGALLASSVEAGQAGAYDDMIQAVNRGDAGTVGELLAQGFDPNTTDKDGYSLLMLAAREGNQKVVEVLLRRHAKTGWENKYGENALMLAAYGGFEPIVRLLLAGGSPLGGRNWTPLQYAAGKGFGEIVSTLLQAGAPVDEATGYGTTALMNAAEGGHIDVIEILLRHGADPSLVRADHATARSLALKKGETDAADVLVEWERKRQAMLSAAGAGDVQGVRAALAYGIPVEIRDAQGNTPLILAAQSGSLPTLQVLLNAGAKEDSCNKAGDNALLVALFENKGAVAKELIQRGGGLSGADWNALHYAVIGNNLEAVDAILARSVSIDVPNSAGVTPLMLAARYGNLDMVRELLKRGASLEAHTAQGESVRDWALQGPSENVALWLDRQALHRVADAVFMALANADLSLLGPRLASSACLNWPGTVEGTAAQFANWLGAGHTGMPGQGISFGESRISGEPRGAYVMEIPGWWQGVTQRGDRVASGFTLGLIVRIEGHEGPRVESLSLWLAGQPPQWCGSEEKSAGPMVDKSSSAAPAALTKSAPRQ